MSKKLSVTFSPHLQDCRSIRSMTLETIAALVPAMLVGFYYFGPRAILIVILSVLAAVLTEAGLQALMGKPVSIGDGTAALTGLLLALLLPVGAPWWAVIVGAAVAMSLGRHLFGGLGANPFNSVLIGWIVLQLSWPEAVNQFYEISPLYQGMSSLIPVGASELPLGLLDFGSSGDPTKLYGWGALLIGAVPGGIGTTSFLALLLGGLYLVARKIVPWQIPLGFLGGQFVFALICWWADPTIYANPVYHLMVGFSLYGAFFLAPDPTTSPYSPFGAILFGLGAGALTMIIRNWGSYQEGVIFGLMFLNALTPVLDRINARSYGRVKTA
ncbi:MAG: RnfABCDGE type electron transport complex subunit D [Pseudomonadota bacterium]